MPSLSPRVLPVLPLTLALVGLLGCPPGEGAAPWDVLLDQASYCPVDFPQAYPSTREVEIGGGLGADFRPYSNSQEVTLFTGDQGLVMIAPTIRVKASSDDGAEACYQVRIVHDYQGAFLNAPEETDTSIFNVRFVKEGDYLITDGALYAPTTHTEDSLDGLDVKLTVTVHGPKFQAVRELHVTFRKGDSAP